ncbi:hypothetical protein CTEN210_00207 [Chaetoceros tenuissimus]|uniref:Aspartic peptidase DDI1-type domain-containing protein n=1 Tax=Chaetoceros tenuissimus TaxID=426638 RepID=A0AAD3CDP0_9STRA|nr:hypothetical protein CTEN210_00207 [Chaetoceros tenuissimus]
MKRAAKSLVICSILVPSLGLPSRNGPMSTPTTIARADSLESTTKHAASPVDTFKSNNSNKSRKDRSRIRSRDYCSRMEDDDLSCHADDRDESTLSSRTSHGPLSSRLENMLQQDRTSVVVAATTVMRKEQSRISNHHQRSRLIQIPMALSLQHDSEITEEIPVATFLDTGAEVTVMTYEAAKRAGIAHLIDTRYRGHASGVAGVSCRVLGRIPANSVSFIINDEDVIDASPAITILEDRIMQGHTVDILLGLDVLEEWQALICLRDKTLTVRNGCRKVDERDIVIPFVGSNRHHNISSKQQKGVKQNPYGLGSHTESSFGIKKKSVNNTFREEKASTKLYGNRSNPFARDSSLLESELDELDSNKKPKSSSLLEAELDELDSRKRPRDSYFSSWENDDGNKFSEDIETSFTTAAEDKEEFDDFSDTSYFESEEDFTDDFDLSGV